MILRKVKSSQARKKPAARRQTGIVHMPATASGLSSLAQSFLFLIGLPNLHDPGKLLIA
jgi:hypothetical protein